MNAPSDYGSTGRACQARFSRNPEILERRIEDSAFLVNPENETVFYLNPLGAGLWHLLAEPTSIAEVVRIVQQAFPDFAPEEIASDVTTRIIELEEKRLVRRYENSD
jgi:hypothetical protein